MTSTLLKWSSTNLKIRVCRNCYGRSSTKVDDLEKLSQDTAKTATTAQTAAGLARAAAERTQKMINLQTIHMLTSVDKIEPDIYKGMLELIEPAKKVSIRSTTSLLC